MIKQLTEIMGSSQGAQDLFSCLSDLEHILDTEISISDKNEMIGCLIEWLYEQTTKEYDAPEMEIRFKKG